MIQVPKKLTHLSTYKYVHDVVRTYARLLQNSEILNCMLACKDLRTMEESRKMLVEVVSKGNDHLVKFLEENPKEVIRHLDVSINPNKQGHAGTSATMFVSFVSEKTLHMAVNIKGEFTVR